MKNRTLPAKSPTAAKRPAPPTAIPPAPVVRRYKLRSDLSAAIVLAAAREGLGFDDFVTRAIRRDLAAATSAATSAAAPALA